MAGIPLFRFRVEELRPRGNNNFIFFKSQPSNQHFSCNDAGMITSVSKLRLVNKRKPLKVHSLRITLVIRINGLLACEFLIEKLRVFAPL